MERALKLRILYVERLNGGLIICFNDGKCGIYPANLLYGVLPQATELLATFLSDHLEDSEISLQAYP